MPIIHLLIAGHDLRFIQPLIDHYRANEDVSLDVYTYTGHQLKETDKLIESLDEYDVIFCEWGLGNLKWFSYNKLPWQQLIVRIHSQELTKAFLAETNWENVDRIIFIARHKMQVFLQQFPELEPKCAVISNLVDCAFFDKPKQQGAEFNLGMLGMLPKLKAPHLALALLQELRKHDNRYRLFIKSRMPEELPWVTKNQAEMEYYKNFFASIEKMGLNDWVSFEPYDETVPLWFSKIGFITSCSDNEGSHMAVAEGIASGTIPVIRNWTGAEDIYSQEFIFNDILESVPMILSFSNDEGKFRSTGRALKNLCLEKFSKDIILPLYDEMFAVIPEPEEIEAENNGMVPEGKDHIVELQKENRKLKAENKHNLAKLNAMRKSSNQLSKDLEDAQRNSKDYLHKMNAMKNSLTWKVGSLLVRKPAAMIKRVFGRTH